jgi:RNA polymerase sigma-70 factor (ECF subfamily)
MDDRELVRRVVEQDDLDAYGVLVRRHQAKAFRLALSVLGPGSEAEAEEVAQDALLRAYRELPGFRGDARFTTWLYRITRNLAVDAARRPHRSRPHVGIESLAGQPSRSQPGPDDLAIRAQRARRVERCIQRLPPRWQATFRLHYWLGHSVAEIAELLGQRPGTVKSHLHRGRRLLARCLEQQGEMKA